jgi:hypothetical protein
MPESHKAEKKRMQKANRAAGIGDESGRIVRVKEAAQMAQCSICKFELKITKTNAELKAHSDGKHGATLEACFPGATAISAEILAKSLIKGSGGSSEKGTTDGPTKKEKKAKAAAGLDDMLSAGLDPKKKGKK